MPAGRPTLYTDEMPSRVEAYLNQCEDKRVKIGKDIKLRVNLPTAEGLAVYLDVNKTTLYEWAKDHEEFSNALEKVKAKQAENLVNKGLSGDYNSTIAKLLLSSNHGMREKSDVTTNGKELPTPLLNALQSEAPEAVAAPEEDD
jgi:hypothetical protein